MHFSDELTMLALYRLCDAVWNLNETVPYDLWACVRDAIGDRNQENKWDRRKNAYAAARRIKPPLAYDGEAA